MSEQLVDFSDPEPEPSNLYSLVPPNKYHEGDLSDNSEQLATQVTIKVIVAQVKEFIKSKGGGRDKFLYSRIEMIHDASNDAVVIFKEHILNEDNTNNNARDFYKNNNLSSKVVTIEIQTQDASKEEIYSVTNIGNEVNPVYTLNRHRYYTVIGPETDKEKQIETVDPVNQASALALDAYLESLKNNQ